MTKLTVLLVAISLHVSAAYAQHISLNVKDKPLLDVLSSIRKQTGYNFIITTVNAQYAHPVTLTLNAATIETTLQKLFIDQPFLYEFDGMVIMIKLKPQTEKKTPVQKENLEQRELNGIVVDDKNKPLEGATVILNDQSNRGTITDSQGRFRFANAPENGTLLIRMLGHETRRVSYQNFTVGSIVIKEIDADLKEIQVIAYGTQQKKFSTNTIATVGAKEIAQQPVSNPLLALQGRVPGLFIEQVSGVSGAGVNVTIQGQNSLQSGNDPFYVIDGVPYSPQFTGYTLAGGALGGAGSAFSFINPADIESISILKDADATAIYGSRAANGAILITTKKGKAGKTKIDVNFQNGWGEIDHKMKLLNTQQYLEMRREGYKNDGSAIPTSATPPSNSNFDLTVYDPNRYTDWQDVLVGGTAHFTNAEVSVSGGSQNTQFLVGYNYSRQTTVYPNSLADKKGNVHFNLSHNSNDNKFKYQFSATYLQDKNKLNSTDLMNSAINLPPNAPALYNVDGSLNWGPYPNNPAKYAFQNPLYYTKLLYTGNTSNLTANNSISYELVSGLQAKVSAGYNKLIGDETSIVPITASKPDAPTKTRSASYLTKSITSWIIEPQLTYTKNTNFGTFDALLGGTFQQTKNDVLGQTGTGYTDDSQLLNIQAASTVNINTVFKTMYKYDAIFARLNYRFQDKYILDLTARRDGSSRFGDANKQHTFYAAGAAWLFRDEEIVKNNLTWLSTGKLRMSYGTTGNDQIADYTYQSLLDIYPVDVPYQGGTSIYPTSISNPYLQWEETRKLNVGTNLGFLKDRIQLDVNYFRNRSSNQLIAYILPSTTGFTGITKNFDATVQNSGIEILLNFSPIRAKNFNWQSSLNFTNPKNKLIAFPNLATSSYAYKYIIGQPINIVQAYKFAGVNPTTGLYQFINSKGETVSSVDATTDRTVLIDPNPKWYGGFSNSFQYKGFQLDFLIQAVKQMAPNYRFGRYPGVGSAVLGNEPIGVLDRWTKPGDEASQQMFSANLSKTLTPALRAKNSDAAYSDASYVRLKNVSLSYTLPTEWLKKARISSARLYMQGQNLITITNFIGTDPETKAIFYLPPLRMYTIGVQVSL